MTDALKWIELVEALRRSETYFPPLLIASAADTLVVETYVSSHPLSGLILCGEPSSAALTPMPTFDYEPFFPLALARTAEAAQHRLMRDYPDEIDVLAFDSEKQMMSASGAKKALDWMASTSL